MLKPEQIRLLSIWYYCSDTNKSENALSKLNSQGINPDEPNIIEEYVNASIQFK